MQLADYRPDDLDEVAELFVRVDAAFPPGPGEWWDLQRPGGFARARIVLDTEYLAAKVVWHGNRIIAFAALKPADDLGTEMVRVMTDPDFERLGIARLLVDSLCAVADTQGIPVWVNVITDDDRNLPGYYERLGFEGFDHPDPPQTMRTCAQLRRPVDAAARSITPGLAG